MNYLIVEKNPTALGGVPNIKTAVGYWNYRNTPPLEVGLFITISQ
jgi:hypothetical protein